jgi:hypothetical protein
MSSTPGFKKLTLGLSLLVVLLLQAIAFIQFDDCGVKLFQQKEEAFGGTATPAIVAAHDSININISSTESSTKPGNKKALAIVHMGPHKTGTTTIQDQSNHYIQTLKKDGYFMPWGDNNANNKRKRKKGSFDPTSFWNQVHFATCFVPPGVVTKYSCNPDLLLHGLKLAKEEKNILISAEGFSHMDEEGVSMLKDYLSTAWDEIQIVVYYRRYYSWLHSLFFEKTKFRTMTGSQDEWHWNVTSFRHNHRHVDALVDLLLDYFDNIQVINFHDDSVRGPDESFFCHAMPDANQTCSAIRKEKTAARSNSGSTFDYSDIAYGAMKSGLVTIKDDAGMKAMSKKIEEHQKSLGLTANDFPRTCPSQEFLDRLWKISLDSEMRFFPDQVNGTKSVADLRSDFTKASKTYLCKVDVAAVLKQSEWIEFFQKNR